MKTKLSQFCPNFVLICTMLGQIMLTTPAGAYDMNALDELKKEWNIPEPKSELVIEAEAMIDGVIDEAEDLMYDNPELKQLKRSDKIEKYNQKNCSALF